MTKTLSATVQRRAKIVCTLGPASNSEAMLRDLMRLGMDVARLNFSHGMHEEHARVIDRVRKVAEREGRTVCILQDLQGPKIRTGKLKYRTAVALKSGSRLMGNLSLRCWLFGGEATGEGSLHTSSSR